MSTLKHIKDLTIKEYEYLQELMNETEPNVFDILDIFGYDPYDMSIQELNSTIHKVYDMTFHSIGVKKIYIINGRRFKACLNLTKISAGQFIDFQNYLQNFKLKEVLSIFLIPQKRKWFKWTTPKYGDDSYDILEVQEFLYNNMLMEEASQLSNFYLTSSTALLKIMKDYLAKKEAKMRLKKQKEKLKALTQDSNGSKPRRMWQKN